MADSSGEGQSGRANAAAAPAGGRARPAHARFGADRGVRPCPPLVPMLSVVSGPVAAGGGLVEALGRIGVPLSLGPLLGLFVVLVALRG